MRKQLHLGAFMRPVGIHTGWWRYPGVIGATQEEAERKLLLDSLVHPDSSLPNGGLKFVGTPQRIADSMQEWLEPDASDGFNVMFHTVPEGLDVVVDLLVPELTRRGIFRAAYTGTTLRDHLGLPRPKNRFFGGNGVSPRNN